MARQSTVRAGSGGFDITTGSSYSVAISASSDLFSGNLSESLNVAPVIGSPENQTQDITGLRRETENTHDGMDVRGEKAWRSVLFQQ